MAKPLWTPTEARVAGANITSFTRALEARSGRNLPGYAALHAWSVESIAAFWQFYADYARLPFTAPPQRIMEGPMPHTRWFAGATINYAQALLYPPALVDAAQPALIAVDESEAEQRLSYAELRQAVGRCIVALERSGVTAGDRVAALVGNVPEAVVLLLACAAKGAIFSSCSPDFGFEAATARFGQIAPKLLLAATGYRYQGKTYHTIDTALQLKAAIPSLSTLVLLPYDELDYSGRLTWQAWLPNEAPEPSFAPLPFDHPLCIVYSSGTTGLPKALVHRAGGVLLTHHKEHFLHCDIKAGDIVFYYTTTGWMMWNWLVSALAQAATLVLYEGSPGQPDLGALWRLAERLGITLFGTSARFIHSCQAAGLIPKALADLTALKTITSTGSPLSNVGFRWVYQAVKDDVHLASISGGTDIVSCFMLGNPTLPVYTGEIQCAGLGVDLAAFDEAGRPVVGQPGELVCRQPLPSMPLGFWHDSDGSRLRQTYFEHYPDVWRHGDLIEITPRGGVIVYGRSDATLNPGGVRIGTAEVYRPLEPLPEVLEALAVGKKEGHDEAIWLFVVLAAGLTLDETLVSRIKAAIRHGASPRHVPKRIFQVSQLPRTRSGKTMELTVARLINGQVVANREAIANPEALEEIMQVLRG
ncbi:MAG: acetoacetate--CoA ligase [Truepera sp.]|nr:acetoacetate--CoA ligase [Truepera sp.]